jgi:hypothetical protein
MQRNTMRETKRNPGFALPLKARAAVAWLLPAALVAGCAGYAPTNAMMGRSAEAVSGELGPPTGRYTLPDGTTRLEYARGPYGKHTYMIDLDTAGRVARVEQVLTERNFESIRPGDARQSVLLLLGRPSEVGRIWRGAELWQYRYEAHICRWFVITLEPDGGGVRDAGYLPDPACDTDRDREPRIVP